MYKKINYIVAIMVLGFATGAQAQVTTSSPYSSYGLGNYTGPFLPQLRAMGDISTAINKLPGSGFNYINVANPASYSDINYTTLDMGMRGSFTQLNKNSNSAEYFNGSLSHLAFAAPVTRHSGLSLGLLPYTNLGYSFQNTIKQDTLSVNQIYQGEGGLSKAYLGYGYRFGDHLRIGGNLEYIFGNLQTSKSTEYNSVGSLNAKLLNKNSIGGVNFSYGIQYDIIAGKKTLITLGYSGSYNGQLSSTQSYFATQYTVDVDGNESTASDTLSTVQGNKSSLKLPLMHNFGISMQGEKWLVGADFRMSKWSDLSINGVNQSLQDSWGASLGGQFTPDAASYNSYFKRVDYRLGFKYDKTYINISNQDINQYGASLGFGFPLPSANGGNTFYKINFTAEVGQRGTLTDNLIRERYLNLHLGFTLNDKWFQRYRLN
ncbi:hypothetical protein ABIB40_002271 [Pedobacter sp. UYP30]|uniref:hypothetical protein n=1 Tax=Pedobacter sp. UYP30 TaxID=1756400 RepID=UPI00339AAE50